MNLDEYEKLNPNAQVDGLTFLTPNSHTAWRVSTLFTKEPDTIAWIKQMRPSETLFDVGANIGQYSMLAAKAGLRVHAFEPEAQNFALLVRNLAINASVLEDRVTAWPIALSNRPGLGILHLSSVIAGGSCHAFGESLDYHGRQHSFPFHQGSYASTLDEFSNKNGFPNHIKIDVDGFEHLVIEGGSQTLAKARTVLIEINTAYPEHMEYILPRMAGLGFNYESSQAEASRRKDGPFKGIGNIIWYRD